MPFRKARSGGRLRKPCAFLTGKERDNESNNDYFGARYYFAGNARWLSVDPVAGDIENPQRLNRYAYVMDDPINYFDPDGGDERFRNLPDDPNPYWYYLWGLYFPPEIRRQRLYAEQEGRGGPPNWWPCILDAINLADALPYSPSALDPVALVLSSFNASANGKTSLNEQMGILLNFIAGYFGSSKARELATTALFTKDPRIGAVSLILAAGVSFIEFATLNADARHDGFRGFIDQLNHHCRTNFPDDLPGLLQRLLTRDQRTGIRRDGGGRGSSPRRP